VLLLNSDLDPRGFRTLAKLCQVREPFAGAPREWEVGRSGMKDVQLRFPDNGQAECAVKCSLAGLLEVDCTEDARQSAHATPQMNDGRTTRPPTSPGAGM
jgi:hypothetical protein